MQTLVNGYGKQLGVRNLEFIVRQGNRTVEKAPFSAVKEISVSSGNTVSTKALALASIYELRSWLLLRAVDR